jgi:HEAT repeat protein
MWNFAFKGLLAGSSLLIGYVLRRQSLQEWRAAAELSGLQDVKVSGWTLKVEARDGELAVRLKGSGDKKKPTRIAVAIPGPPGFQGVTIRSASLLDPAWGIETGDEAFDNAFSIDGPAQLVPALLDGEMRRLWSRLYAECWLQLSSGELRAHLADEMTPVLLPRLLELGRRLAQPLDVPRRLAENARLDAKPGVRLQNLLVLIRELPDDPRTAWALRDACSDSVPEIRLRAAKALGEEGRGVLLELAEGSEDDAVSAEAVSALDRELPFERAKAILDRALRHRSLRTALACLESLARSGAAAVGVLAKVLERREGELAVAAARALGATGSQAAEPPLISALQRDQEDLRLAAAEALGRVGSAAAVLPLQETAERLDADFRRAARQAIAEIQSRAQGASPGQLSLAGVEAGQLSLAEDPAGQLSLPSGERPE